MLPHEFDYSPVRDAEETLACREVLREEAVLARLDPDQIGDELPSDVPPAAAAEWWEFVALCARLDAGEEAVLEQPDDSDRSAGCP